MEMERSDVSERCLCEKPVSPRPVLPGSPHCVQTSWGRWNAILMAPLLCHNAAGYGGARPGQRHGVCCGSFFVGDVNSTFPKFGGQPVPEAASSSRTNFATSRSRGAPKMRNVEHRPFYILRADYHRFGHLFSGRGVSVLLNPTRSQDVSAHLRSSKRSCTSQRSSKSGALRLAIDRSLGQNPSYS